jgi:hypothetical protein
LRVLWLLESLDNFFKATFCASPELVDTEETDLECKRGVVEGLV